MPEYITISDITNVHLKQFPDEILQPYVDEANTHLQDIGMQLGLMPDQIVIPVSIVVKRCLVNYVVMRFAEDSLGTNNPEITMNDMYAKMQIDFHLLYETWKKQITPELLEGVSENSRRARSVSTGYAWRTR